MASGVHTIRDICAQLLQRLTTYRNTATNQYTPTCTHKHRYPQQYDHDQFSRFIAQKQKERVLRSIVQTRFKRKKPSTIFCIFYEKKNNTNNNKTPINIQFIERSQIIVWIKTVIIKHINKYTHPSIFLRCIDSKLNCLPLLQLSSIRYTTGFCVLLTSLQSTQSISRHSNLCTTFNRFIVS